GTPVSLLRASEQGCIEVDGAQADSLRRYPLPQDADGLVPLCLDTFANEALILDRQITAAVLLDRDRSPVARVESGAPVWLFWSQQGQHCPYVCAEPWYGLPDLQGFSGDISRRAFIQQAGPGETWRGGYSVEIL
ncbi:MAG: hypothetical protein IJV64_01595, partial [Oscillospiraceae bacterium]|nr:hypothetical protein [Oscillospiraceae bacterium]